MHSLYSYTMLILNNRELEERLTNEWEEVMSSLDSARRLDVSFCEPVMPGPGAWLWTDANGYHIMVRAEDGIEVVQDLFSFNDVEFFLFKGPILRIAESMHGDLRHNVSELCSAISPSFQKSMMAALDEEDDEGEPIDMATVIMSDITIEDS